MNLIYLVIFCFFEVSMSLYAQTKTQLSDRKIHKSLQKVEDFRKGNMNKITETTYDKQGNPIEIIEHINGQFAKHELTVYKNFNVEESVTRLDSLGKIQEVTTFLFDSFGNSMGYKTVNSAGEITEELVIELNKFNDKIKETYFESNHTLKSFTTYDYDKKGLIKEKCIYNDLGKLIYRKVNNYE